MAVSPPPGATVYNSNFHGARIAGAWGPGIANPAPITYHDNLFEYIGGNAVMVVANSTLRHNGFYRTHDEFSWGYIGGQVFISGENVNNVTVASNTIDATISSWPDPTSWTGGPAGTWGCRVMIRDCLGRPVPVPAREGPLRAFSVGGIEVGDKVTDIRLWNNDIVNHPQAGIGISGLQAADATLNPPRPRGYVEITGYDPEYPGNPRHDITTGGWHGVWVHDSSVAPTVPLANRPEIRFYHVKATNNLGPDSWGIRVEPGMNVTATFAGHSLFPTNWPDFGSGACLSGNSKGTYSGPGNAPADDCP